MLYTQLTLRPRKKNSPQSQVDISLASLEDIQKKKKIPAAILFAVQSP